MLASIEGHLRRQAGAHRPGLPRRAFRRRPRPAVRVRDRPAQFPAPAADVGLAPRLHGRGRALRRDDDHRHRAWRHRRRDARRCLRRCRRPGRRPISRCRWPTCLPAKWISTASCNRATASAWSSTSRSAITASSATARSSAATLQNAGRTLVAIRFAPGGADRRGTTTRDGKSLKRFFLRSPLKFDPSISSGFSRAGSIRPEHPPRAPRGGLPCAVRRAGGRRVGRHRDHGGMDPRRRTDREDPARQRLRDGVPPPVVVWSAAFAQGSTSARAS